MRRRAGPSNCWNEALRQYEKAIGLDPNYARAYVGIAQTYNYLGRYGTIGREEGAASAREYLEKAIERDDELGEAYALLALVSRDPSTLRPDSALLEKALTLNPNDPRVLRAQALSLCIRDHSIACKEESAAIQLEAIRRSPEDPGLYFELAFLMMELGRLDEVPKYFSEAVRRNPDMTTGYTRLGGWYYGFEDDAARGVACLKEAIARDPKKPVSQRRTRPDLYRPRPR